MIKRLRKGNRLLSAISVSTAVLLLTGEWFNCCRINEAFADEVRHVAQSMGLIRHASPVAEASEDQDNHPHCHGHEASEAAHPDHDVIPASSAYTQDASCLSESAITKQSMVGSASFTLEISPPLVAFNEVPILCKFVSVERPRPQNRSSPPVYLLTLHLLV